MTDALLAVLAVLAFQAVGLGLGSVVYGWRKYDLRDQWAGFLLACAWPVIFTIYGVSTWRFKHRNARLIAKRKQQRRG